jgi:hypothetical protein
MVACLGCGILISATRTSRAAWDFAGILLFGIAINLLYIEIRNHQKLQFLERSMLNRWFLRFCLFAPLFVVCGFAVSDFFDRRAPIFKDAILLLEESGQANGNLGTPIRVEWPIEGTQVTEGGSGRWTMRIPVSGLHGRGTLQVGAAKSGGIWKIDKMILILDDGSVQENLLKPQ